MSFAHVRNTLVLLTAIGLCGCGGGTAAVSGKVTAEGKEVTAGTVILSPLDAQGLSAKGQSGVGEVGKDGSYSVTLAAGPDGLAQKFDVRYTPPPVQATAKNPNVVVPYAGLVPKEATAAVKPGANVINIELVPATRKK